MTELTARELLLHLYHSALEAVDGRLLVGRWLQQHPGQGFSHIVAIGKAAPAMLQGALDQLEGIEHSLLICPPDKINRRHRRDKRLSVLPGGHPLPDENSLAAGEALLDFLRQRQGDERVLFLISGGSSAMVEVPRPGIDLECLQQLNRYLLGSGMDIAAINRWRAQFSRIKGGGLLDYLQVPATQLLISDVRDDRLDLIGSGLLQPLQQRPPEDDYLQSLLSQPLREVDSNGESPVPAVVIGNLAMALQAAADAARAEGLPVRLHPEFVGGDVHQAADALFRQMCQSDAGVDIWGGETTVLLPDNPGVGGRNLSLALAVAQKLENRPGLHLLAAGSDGVDGNSPWAGGVVCHYTMEKAQRLGFDIARELQACNAGMVLNTVDDVVHMSDSHTNVMDLMIAYKTPDAAAG